jgi:hypothetical protein
MFASDIDWLADDSRPDPTVRKPLGMNKESIAVPIGSESVRGTLLFSEDIWAFSSPDPAFVRLYPTGTTYSFSDITSKNEGILRTAITEAYSNLKMETE